MSPRHPPVSAPEAGYLLKSEMNIVQQSTSTQGLFRFPLVDFSLFSHQEVKVQGIT